MKHMKKYLLYTMLLALTAISACKKGIDPPAGQRPEERVSTTTTAYSNSLTGNTNGWKAFLYPYGGGVYLFSMKFTAANRVTMLSDISTATSTTSLESSFKIKQQLQPSLLFDTYSYIHQLSDPDPTVAGGAAGAGLNSDFEFYFDSMSAAGDTIKLVGNRLGSKLVLVKIANTTDYGTFTTGTADIVTKAAQLRTYWERATIGTTDCEINLNTTAKKISITYLVNGNPTTVSSLFYIDGSTLTLTLLTPVTVAGTVVSTIKSITLDATNRVLNGTLNGAAFALRESITPLKFDPTAAQKWYTQMPLNFNNCWISEKGYHYGVDDFCNFRNIPGFTSFWFAGASVLGADGIIVFTTGLASPYVQSSTAITPANLARFTILANVGTFTGTGAQAMAMTAARNIMYGGATAGSSADWYLVPTAADGVHYDMVRASDAQAWISWHPR
jgi:hypothetical protein